MKIGDKVILIFVPYPHPITLIGSIGIIDTIAPPNKLDARYGIKFEGYDHRIWVYEDEMLKVEE